MGHLQHLPHVRHLPHVFGSGRGTANYARAITRAGPVAWWRMASTADSAGAHTLTLTGTPSQSQSGAIKNDANTSTLFSTGSESATFANATDLRFASGESITIEAWIRPSTSSDGGNYQYIIHKGATADVNANWAFRIINSEIDFYYAAAGSPRVMGSTGAGLVVGKWFHVVVSYTFGGTAIAMYVNGVSLATSPTFGVWDGTAPDLNTNAGEIGYSSGLPAHPFLGWIDEVAIYRRILSAGEVLNHYNLGAKTMVSLANVTALGDGTAAFDFNGALVPLPSSLTTTQTAMLEVNAGGSGYIHPNATVTAAGNQIANDISGLASTIVVPYAVTPASTNAWRILTDPTAFTFGPDKYLRVPSSGVLA